MTKNIVITDSYMISVEKLNNQERKQAIKTIKQMKKDISIPALKVHAIDRAKCDSRFRSARVSSDLRIIFMQDGDFCTLLYIAHHDDAYDWCEGKYYKKTDFGAAYIFDVVQEENMIQKVQKEQKEDYNINTKLLEGKITRKELVKLGISTVHADNLLMIDSEEVFMDYISIFPEELQEGLFDIYYIYFSGRYNQS